MIEPLGSLSGRSLGSAGIGEPGFASLGRSGRALDPTGSDEHGSFLDALGEAVTRLNTQLTAADAAAADFGAGGSTDLHDVVLALTEAGIGLRLGVAVRDRLLEAYHDVMRLQI